MHIKPKLALAAAGLLGVVGVGGGVAFAQTTHSPRRASIVKKSAVKAQAPEPAGPDTDSVQQGDQTTPDAAGTESSSEAPETAGSEKPGTEEPGDANLPGGGHADAPGQNVDNQFEGVQ